MSCAGGVPLLGWRQTAGGAPRRTGEECRLRTKKKPPELHALPRFLLTRCLVLALLTLLGALLLLFRAGDGGLSTYPLWGYAAGLAENALILFAAGLVGSLLAEDVLRKM